MTNPPPEDIIVSTNENETVRDAVNSYVKDKRYISSSKTRGQDLNPLQMNRQMIFNKMVKSDIFTNNFSFFSNVGKLTLNAKLIETQFSKLTDFVESLRFEVRGQLRRFYGPLMCHFYLEILKLRETYTALCFLRRNIQYIPTGFESVVQIRNVNPQVNMQSKGRYFVHLVKILSTCSTVEATEKISEIVALRSSKFEIDLNFQAMSVLNDFLKNKDNLYLLSMVHMWIHINIVDIREIKTEVTSPISERQQFTDVPPPMPGGPLMDQYTIFESAIRNIHRTMYEIGKLQSDYPQCIGVFDPEKLLTSGHSDKTHCHIALGFDSSEVRLWQENHQRMLGKSMYSSYNESCCGWNVNYIEEEEEDDDGEIQSQSIVVDQTEGGEIILRGHARGVTDVCFSHTHPVLLSVSKDESMRCWSAKNYQCASVYFGHTNPVWCVAESPNSPYVATGSRDLTARLWNLEREHPLITYVGHLQDINGIAFHPNGSYMATVSDDFTMRMWSVSTGNVLRVFADSKKRVNTVSFSPDGKYLAAAGEECKVRVFDITAGRQLFELNKHNEPITSISWSRYGDKIVSGCTQGEIKIWDIKKLNAFQTNGDRESNLPLLNGLNAVDPVTFDYGGLSRVCRVEYSSDDALVCIGRK